MNYLESIQQSDARQLESLFRTAKSAGSEHAFISAIQQLFADTPENPLYAAWHYRLEDTTSDSALSGLSESNLWLPAIIFSLLGALVGFVLSDIERITVLDKVPFLLFAAAPLIAIFMTGFLGWVSKRHALIWLLVTGVLAAAVIYAIQILTYMGDLQAQRDPTILLLLHLAALAVLAVGIFALWRNHDAENRFAFLLKALEVAITGGLFAIAGGIFTIISFGLFEALGVTLPDWAYRIFAAGGAGLIPVLALATSYRPDLEPKAQPFGQGLSRLIATLMRLLLPLTLLLLTVYIGFILFNFWEPFLRRDVLIVYNIMLFALMALLVGVTPMRSGDLSPRLASWLRGGILLLSTLATLVSLYALAAIVYRTWDGGITPNRFVVIGWNVINIAVLLILLAKQRRSDSNTWVTSLHAAASIGVMLYALWIPFVFLSIVWLFSSWYLPNATQLITR